MRMFSSVLDLLGSIWLIELNLVQALHHVVIEVVVVPIAYHDSNSTDQDTLNTANVRDPVKNSVPVARHYRKIQVALKCYVHLH